MFDPRPADDAQVVEQSVLKRYCGPGEPVRAVVAVTEVDS